jgi:hypothetical protein
MEHMFCKKLDVGTQRFIRQRSINQPTEPTYKLIKGDIVIHFFKSNQSLVFHISLHKVRLRHFFKQVNYHQTSHFLDTLSADHKGFLRLGGIHLLTYRIFHFCFKSEIQSFLMSSATTKAITVLTDAFPADRIALPDTDVYKTRIESYVSLLESEIQSAAIFLPKNQDEVAEFVQLMGPLVDEHDARFAVRGAGQQPLPGCANIEDGVTIDLSELQNIEVCDEVVQIGAGCRWTSVYDRLQEDGLGVTGGRSGNNGIGGLALSGKIDFTHH